MPIWSDFFKLFNFATEQDPLAKRKDPKYFKSAGVSQPDALNAGDPTGGGGSFRETTEMIDTTTLTNRPMRYKEYERLRNVPEIEMAMQVFADEACVAGDTKIATPFGFITIKELAETKGDERFLVYAYDFHKKDYTLAWAFAPRLVKEEQTMTIVLDNGTQFTVTADHRVLRKNGTWSPAGQLKFGDELMPFYRQSVNTNLNKLKRGLFARIFSFEKGWIHERQFVDDWKSGKTSPEYERCNRAVRMIAGGLTTQQIVKVIGHDWQTVEGWVNKQGFSTKEIKWLHKHENRRRIIGIHPGPKQAVYDLSVDDHHCFATDSVILHNCQKDEDGNIFKVEAKNDEIREEIEFLLLHRKMLNMNRNGLTWFKNLAIFGDWFVELVVNPDNPKEGIYRAVPLPPETMYRIESIKGRVIEFQQSKEGPDYQSLIKGPITGQNEMELNQTTAIRFAPSQIVHFRIGDDRKTFFPYGQSLIEPARGPAHSLRLMEDAMLVYRLTRAPERRVFYIDVGQLPPFKAESFIERLKDQFRKRKVASNRGGAGANSVEERWQPPAQDEDYWLPIRPNSNTRIDTLPGAENLGEIDDAVYFRNKLLTALNFPKNYFNNEDPGATRITLSAQDVKFARMIERLQSHFEDGILEIAERHLQLRGFPEESYQDLRIKMTAPSDWRELSRAEVVTARYGNAGTLKSGQLMSDYDIYVKILKYSEEDSEEMLARLKLQKLEDLKLQVLAQNPQLLGIGIPGQDAGAGNQELGSEAGGPSAMPAPPGAPPMPDASGGMGGAPPPPTTTASGADDTPPLNPGGKLSSIPPEGANIPEPNEEDIKKYDLELQDYESEQDLEDIDYSTGD
jgi:hypothetical protein